MAASSSASPHTLLLVEDDRSIRELLIAFLQDEGFSVVGAADGQMAIQLIEQLTDPARGLCLILLDMMMPGVDGPSVIDYLVTRGLMIPVVAMSASKAHLLAAQAKGARATVAKPFELDQLLQAVSSQCSHNS